MNGPVSSGLKTTFLIHAIVGILIGLGYLLIPTTVGGWFGVDMADPGWRILGAAILGYGVSSWWGYRAGDWSEVAIVVKMEVVWTLLGALATIWGLTLGALPAMAWVNAIILLAFTVAFGYFWMQKR